MTAVVKTLGYGFVLSKFNDVAGKHFNPKNPYYDEDGATVRLPASATKDEKKYWKHIQRQAWRHDKCCIGGCGVGMDCGLGIAPIIVLLPVIGPYLMYLIHQSVIKSVQKKYNLPAKMVAQMQTNALIDLGISIPPIIGFFLSWLNRCSTRNASLIYKYLVVVASERLSIAPTGTIRNEKHAYPETKAPKTSGKPETTEKRGPQQTFLDNFRRTDKSKGHNGK